MTSTDDSLEQAAAPGAARRWIPTTKQFFLILLGYFALQVALRTLIAPHALELDEAEQLTLAQKWSWGYNSQPPLYCWLQISLFNLFGASVFAISVLKNTLLFFNFVFTYLAARQITRNDLAALAAAASILFFPEIAWHSQIDRTHSVLAIMLASAVLWIFLRVAARRNLSDYLLLGLCAGLALIAKYNVVFFLVGLPLAAVSLPEYRAAILNKRMLPTLGIILAIFLPNGIWMIKHPDLAFMAAYKFDISKASGVTARVIGLGKIAAAACAVLGPLLAVHTAIFLRKNIVIPFKSQPPTFRLLWRTGLIILLCITIAVMASGTTSVRERWLQPVLGFTPILSLIYFQRAIIAVRVRQVLTVSAVVMAAVLIFFPARLLYADPLKMPERLNLPMDALGPQIDRSLGNIPVVITDTWLMSGDLRLNVPDRVYASPEFAALVAPDADRVGVVWDATQKDAPPKMLADYLQKAGINVAEAQPEFFSAPCRNSKSKTLRVAVVVAQKQKPGWPVEGP